MKQISAILMACFLFVGVSQVSAQQMSPKIVNENDYQITASDSYILFFELVKGYVNTTCTLPDAKTSRGLLLRLMNRRNNDIMLKHKTDKPIKLPFDNTLELMSDGNVWMVLSASFTTSFWKY
jgi:YbbR domain-containing protein